MTNDHNKHDAFHTRLLEFINTRLEVLGKAWTLLLLDVLELLFIMFSFGDCIYIKFVQSKNSTRYYPCCFVGRWFSKGPSLLEQLFKASDALTRNGNCKQLEISQISRQSNSTTLAKTFKSNVNIKFEIMHYVHKLLLMWSTMAIPPTHHNLPLLL